MMKTKLIDLMYSCGNLTGCHQIQERSFFYKGYQFPVCARCTGVFVGHLFFFWSLLFKYEIGIYAYSFFCLIMLVDWSLQFTEIKLSTNKRRFITGILGGWGLFGLYYNIIIVVISKVLDMIKKI